jgi:hypothetical protein
MMENQITPTLNSLAEKWQDPILLELHATRERLANEYGNDIRVICDAARTGFLSHTKIKNTVVN